MTEQDAKTLLERIKPELSEGFTAWVGYRLFSPDDWHVIIRHQSGRTRQALPDIYSYRQWRANRHKLEKLP